MENFPGNQTHLYASHCVLRQGTTRRPSLARLLSLGWTLLASLWLAISSPAIAQTVIGTHALASSPYAIAINQITNRTYVTHGGSVTVIDGATNTASTIAVGGALRGLAVNPATNRIYVVNWGHSVKVYRPTKCRNRSNQQIKKL